jgi:putative hydrolase of the HAD superfamily
VIRGILFDLDNTLLDFMRMKASAVEAAVGAMIDAGMPLTREEATARIFEIYQVRGIEYQEVFDQFLSERFGSINPKWLAAGIVAYRRAREAALVLYPHVNYTLIELLKRGLRLAVISDAPRKEVWLRLCYLDLHHVFDPVITFEDTGERKPSPGPFERALELLKMESSEVLMVGDWPERDMVGAKKLGIRTVFARYGDTFGTEESGADFEINDLSELLGILDRLEDEASVEPRRSKVSARK